MACLHAAAAASTVARSWCGGGACVWQQHCRVVVTPTLLMAGTSCTTSSNKWISQPGAAGVGVGVGVQRRQQGPSQAWWRRSSTTTTTCSISCKHMLQHGRGSRGLLQTTRLYSSEAEAEDGSSSSGEDSAADVDADANGADGGKEEEAAPKKKRRRASTAASSAASKKRPPQLQASIDLLVSECGLAAALHGARVALAGRHILGLDINTSSTGYAVLRVAACDDACAVAVGAAAVNGSGGGGGGVDYHISSPRAAPLLECGRVCTKGAEDVLDGGAAITRALRAVAERLDPGYAATAATTGYDIGGDSDGSGDSGGVASGWLVGVEDFAKSFTVGRFQTKSLFSLAQLNGIVRYSCQRTFGGKPAAWHANSARAFYGVTKARGTSDDVKRIVFEHVLRRELGDGTTTATATATADDSAQLPIAPGDTFGGYRWEFGVRSGVPSKDNYDVTDAYLIATYTWHQALVSALRADAALRAAFHAASEGAAPARAARARGAAAAAAAAAEEAAAAAGAGTRTARASGRRAGAAADAARRDRLDRLFEEALDAWSKDVLAGGAPPDALGGPNGASSGASGSVSAEEEEAAAVVKEEAPVR